jgi:hypothetical protein
MYSTRKAFPNVQLILGSSSPPFWYLIKYIANVVSHLQSVYCHSSGCIVSYVFLYRSFSHCPSRSSLPSNTSPTTPVFVHVFLFVNDFSLISYLSQSRLSSPPPIPFKQCFPDDPVEKAFVERLLSARFVRTQFCPANVFLIHLDCRDSGTDDCWDPNLLEPSLYNDSPDECREHFPPLPCGFLFLMCSFVLITYPLL